MRLFTEGYGKMKLKAVKAWLKLWLMTAMLISSLNSVHVAVATTSSAGNNPVDITDLAVELQGYDAVEYTYTYDEWRAYLESINIPFGDNYLSAGYWVYFGGVKIFFTPSYIPPENFLLLEYTNTQSGKIVDMEIYEYDSTENATAAFDNQYHGELYCGRIFDRFSAVQVMLHRGQFMVFIFCSTEQPDTDTLAQSTLSDCTQKFADNLFNVLPGSTQPSPPPSVNFTGKVVWGVKPGDIISWESNWTTFTGYVGGGMGHTEGSYTIIIEIVQITDDNLAILIRSPEKYPSDFDYVGSADLVLPAYRYYWATVTDPVIPPRGEPPCPIIFPIYSEGQTLKDVIESNTDCTDFTEGAEYITGHSKTAPEEYTPTETRWEDVTLHKGSGIVTKASSYYNSNYYSITTSHSLTLKNTNFDLSSRVPYTPEQGEIPSEYTLSVLETTKNSIRISWTASTDDRFAKYEIYQSTSSGDLGTKINTITDRSTTSYTIPGLSANTTYYFTVKVVYTDSSSTDYNQVSGTTKSRATSTTIQFPLPLLAGAAVAVVATVIVVAAIFLKRRKSLAPQPSEHPIKSSQPPPPSSIEVAQPKEKGVHGISATEEEQLLGGLTSGDLHLKGKVSFGYGIYVTNKRIIGVKSMKGLLASGLLGLAGLWVGRTDSSAKAIAELEEKKDIEVRKEDVSEIEMKKPHGIRAGYLNIALNSGGSVTVLIGNKKEFEPIKNLMAAFRPAVLKAEE